MKRVITFFLLCVGCMEVFAQAGNAVSQKLYTNRADADRLELVQANATQLAADTIKQSAVLRAIYQHGTGGLRYAQQAYNQQEAGLFTEGLSTLGRVRIAGKFKVTKAWEDSLGNYLGGYFDDFSPYYYFATKPGKYQGQRYQMKMVLAYELSKNIYLGLGAAYDYRWTTRSVDPRPEDNMMELEYTPSISYKLGNTMLGLGYIGGYGKGSIDISYQNRMFNLSTLYPDRYYYMNMGYGNIALKYGVITKRSLNTQGVSLNLASSFGKYLIKADFSYRQEEIENRKALDTVTMSTFFSRWTVDHYKADVLLRREANNSLQQLRLRADLKEGEDLNSLYSGTNFLARQTSLHLRYEYQVYNNKRWQPAYGFFAGMEEGYKKDILAAHDISYTILQPGVSFSLQNKEATGGNWRFQVEPSLVIPLSVDWQVPATQENVFTRSIMYQDIYYRNAQKTSLSAMVAYTSRNWLRNTPAGLYLQADWMHAVGQAEGKVPPVASGLGKNRLVVQAGFQVYL